MNCANLYPNAMARTRYLLRHAPIKPRPKNAQEAHEAIRPTSIRNTPEDIKKYLSAEQFKLYDLIWKRTIS